MLDIHMPDIHEMMDRFLSEIIDSHGNVPPEVVIEAFQMAIARIALAFEKTEGEVLGGQQLFYHRIKDLMIKDGTYGCGNKGSLSDIMRN